MIESITHTPSACGTISLISMNSCGADLEHHGDELNLPLARPETVLFGRDSEADVLMKAFHRAAAEGSASELVLVSGSSGTGKSSLIENLRRPVAAAGGYFVSAKFDQVRTNSPFSALSAALSDLCDLVVQDEVTLRIIRQRIKLIVQDETAALSNIISNLAQVTGESPSWSDSSMANMSQTFQRFKISCKLFIRAIATPAHPVVIFLDDLHWSDFESLVVLRSLVADLESQNVLLVAAYRSDELPAAATVMEAFRFDTKQELSLRQHHLKLDNLDEVAVNNLVSYMIQMPASSEEIKELSKVLHTKTHGNAYFLVSLVQNLEMHGMIQFEITSSLWTWDLMAIRNEIVVTDNVLTLLQKRLRRLPAEIKDLLIIASYIGFRFRSDVLAGFVHQERQIDNMGSDVVDVPCVEKLLEVSVKEGLIEKAGCGSFRFGHDKIQQCLFDAVGNDEARADLRYRLGWFLHTHSSIYGEDVVFSAADNLNQGCALVKDSQRVNVADVNLAAGVAAKAKSAFRSAAEYASQGLAMLGPNLPWNQKYQLTLGLTTLLAESKYCLGEFENAMEMVNEVLLNAKNNLDKVAAYMVSIDTTAARGEINIALEKCVDIVCELGDPFPRNPSIRKVISQFMRTKRRMKMFSDEDILTLPRMKDAHFLAIMQVHRSLQLYAILTHQKWYIGLSVLRMLDVSLRYGYSPLTPSALATYGMVFIEFGDTNIACHYASLALRLHDIIGLKQGRCRTAISTYCCCLHHKNNINSFILPLRDAIMDGLCSGDIEESFFIVGLYANMCFNGGIRLSEIVEDLTNLDTQFTDYKNHTLLLYKAVLTLALNLMGTTDDALSLSSSVMNEKQAFLEAESANDKVMVGSLQSFKMFLYYHLGDCSMALKYANILCKSDKVGKTNPEYYIYRFYYGMVFLRMARETGKRKYISMARRKSMRVVRRFQQSPNAKPLLLLLKAEYAAVRGSLSVQIIEKLFNAAIESLAKEGFIQIEALANECASVALSEASPLVAGKYMTEAIGLYSAWHANAKVEYLEG